MRASFDAPARFAKAAMRFALVNEQVTAVSSQSSRPPETTRRLTPRRRIKLGALFALAVAADVRKTHKLVRLAFTKVGYQTEISDSSAARPLAPATSGQVRHA